MTETTRVVEFDVGDNTYCLNINAVDQVISPEDLSDAPELDDSALGVMSYRDDAVEVWDAMLLLSNEEVATIKRKKEIDAELEDKFDDFEYLIERYVEKGKFTESDAQKFAKRLTELREQIVTGPVNMDTIIDNYDVILLDEEFKNETRRVGWLVHNVKDVRQVSRNNLDQSVGGTGIYGVLRDEVDDTEEGEEDEQEDLTVWVNPKKFV